MKKKVAIITTQAFSLINFRNEVIKKFIAEDYEVYALAPDFNKEIINALGDYGVIAKPIYLSRTLLSPIKLFKEFINLILQLRKIKPDITLTYFAKALFLGNIAAIFLRIKSRFSIIEGMGNSGSLIRNNEEVKLYFLSLIYKFSLFKIKKVFFTNRHDMNFFVSRKIISANIGINIGGIGVDLQFWQCPERTPSKYIRFILASRMIKSKGIIDYLNAAKKLKKKYTADFLLVGGFDLNSDSLTELDITPYVDSGVIEWYGNIKNVKDVLCSCDVFVLPSYYGEGVPRSIQEAMSCAMPVITTKSVGCEDTVFEGSNGILIKPKSTQELVSAMETYIKDRNLIYIHGSSSRKLAIQNFDEHKKSSFLVKMIIENAN